MIKEDIGTLEYFSRLRNRWRPMAAIFIVICLVVAVITFSMKPVYKAVAEIYIDPGAGSQFGTQPAMNPLENKVYIKTQLSILKSDAIARKAVTSLHLDQAAADKPGLLMWPFSLLFSLARATDSPVVQQDAVESFKHNLKADAINNSNVIEVTYTAGDPVLAASAVNTAVQALVEQNLDMKVAPAREAMQWLNGSLEKIKANMTDTATRLQDFKQDKGLLVTGENDTNISLKNLSDLTSKALAAEVRRNEAEVKYQRVLALSKEEDGLMSLPEVIDNKLIQDLKNQEAVSAKQSAELTKRYGEKHPQIIRLKNEKDTMDRQIQAEVSHIVASIKNDYHDSLRVEQSLKASLGRQKAAAMNYERRSSEYELKKQDVDGAKGVYDTVLKRLQESSMMNLNISTINFFQKAEPPLKPYKPKIKMNLLMGLALAVFSSLCAGMVLEYLDRTCKTPEDIQDNLGLAVLGVVPRSLELVGRQLKGVPLLPKPASVAAEAFRDIKGNMLLRADMDPRLIQVCSAMHSEGKSTVALNFANSLAAVGERVLLVDADVRRPSLHRLLGQANTKGLTSLLTEKAGIEEVVIKTRFPNLYFIPSGPAVTEMGMLLRSPAMYSSMESWRANFDRVVIDSPPYVGPVDAHLISSMVDGVVLVVLSGKTDMDLLSRTLRNLESLKINILGCVLNDALNKSYYYNNRYYNYGNEPIDV